ncbi:hypothetical protein ACFLVO_04225 [Chloroflexota bacterium]
MKHWNGITKLNTKRGKYGASKLKAFSVLAGIPTKHYLSVRRLCLMSGIGYYSLARALPKWVVWEYVARYPTTSIGEGDYMYQLLAKGRSWLNLALAQLPNAHIFIKELDTWQSEIMYPARFEEYMVLPFNEFVVRLHEQVKVLKWQGPYL